MFQHEESGGRVDRAAICRRLSRNAQLEMMVASIATTQYEEQ
jgi:hypothetical protein